MEALESGSVYFMGLRIRDARVRLRMTVEQLAVETGLSPSSIRNIEAGRRPVSPRILPRFAKALKVSPSHFLEASGGAGLADNSQRDLLAIWGDLGAEERELLLEFGRLLARRAEK